MKKQQISINYNKLANLANAGGYINLEAIFNKEEKKKEGETWELYEIGFISTKAPKGEKGIIVGNISEFRNKEKFIAPKPAGLTVSDMSYGEAIDESQIPF